VVTVCTSVYLVMGYPYGPILLSLLVAVYTVARYLPIRRAAAVSAGGPRDPVAARGDRAGDRARPARHRARFGLGGGPVRGRRHSRPEPGGVPPGRGPNGPAGTPTRKRLRVAQEVHDVVGHGLSAIAMQADIALHLLPKQPDQAVTAG